MGSSGARGCIDQAGMVSFAGHLTKEDTDAIRAYVIQQAWLAVAMAARPRREGSKRALVQGLGFLVAPASLCGRLIICRPHHLEGHQRSGYGDV